MPARFRITIVLAVALAYAAAATLAACGGDDGSDDPATRIDAACTDGAKRLTELTNEKGAPFNLNQASDYLPGQISIEEDVLAEIKDVGAPEGQRAAFDEMTANRQGQIDSLGKLLELANDKKVDEYMQAGNALESIQDKGYAIAAGLDLNACAGELPSDQRDELESTIQDIFTTGDPAHCTEDYTAAYVERQAGANGLCEQLERTESQATKVVVDKLHGVKDVNAAAVITLSGSGAPVRAFRVGFVRDDDRWKLDSMFEVPPPHEGATQ